MGTGRTCPRSRPTGTTWKIDVAVVGAGLTGLSAALALARAGKSVLVLEKEAPGFGASSRNGGMIGGGHKLSANELVSRYGKNLATRILTEAHLESGAFTRNLITEENIDCDYKQSGRFRGLWRTTDFKPSAAELDAVKELIPLEAHMISRQEQFNEV